MKITGSCLCDAVRYELSDTLGIFQYCHCSRCRKFTGSAHASNLFVKPEHFSWNQGEAFVGRYEPEDTKHFATCFCRHCGSSLPWVNKSKSLVIVPAGTLDDEPPLQPKQSIYWDSRAPWFRCVGQLKKFDELPPRRS